MIEFLLTSFLNRRTITHVCIRPSCDAPDSPKTRIGCFVVFLRRRENIKHAFFRHEEQWKVASMEEKTVSGTRWNHVHVQQSHATASLRAGSAIQEPPEMHIDCSIWHHAGCIHSTITQTNTSG